MRTIATWDGTLDSAGKFRRATGARARICFDRSLVDPKPPSLLIDAAGVVIYLQLGDSLVYDDGRLRVLEGDGR